MAIFVGLNYGLPKLKSNCALKSIVINNTDTPKDIHVVVQQRASPSMSPSEITPPESNPTPWAIPPKKQEKYPIESPGLVLSPSPFLATHLPIPSATPRLNPQASISSVPSVRIDGLTKEIIILSQNAHPIGPDHYKRLMDSLNAAQQAGANAEEIKKLRDMVEQLNPEKIISTAGPSQANFRKDPEIPSPQEMANIPSCANQQFITPPVEMTNVYEISPLGNLGPPGHTFPTEHMFFHLTAGGVTTQTVPLAAPADIYITLISMNRGLTNDKVDYTIWFSLCRDVLAYYNHVKTISPQLEEIMAKNECQFPGESKQTRCNIETITRINNATSMGGVGALQGNFDFGIIDLRKKLTFANPNRYGTRSLFIQCALDYYEPALKSQLFSRIKRSDKKCGETAQDVAGTLQGNWFVGNARADSGTDWDKYLAFVRDSNDPNLLVVSIGGTITNAKKIEFRVQNTGVINRNFRDIAPNGSIYCFESSTVSGRVLAQLISATELKAEHQTNNCSDTIIFQQSSAMYLR